MARAIVLLPSLLLVTLMVMATVPSLASANAVISVQYEVDQDEARVLLTAREPVLAPTWRITRGRIAMWIPGMDEDTRHDPSTDGWAIRRVRVRPGVDDNAVLQIVLRDERIVPREAVSVEVAGERVTVRIARAALPPGPLEAANAPGAHDVAPSADDANAADPTAAIAAPAGALAPAAEDAAAEHAANDEVAPDENDASPSDATTAAAPRPSPPRSLASTTANGSNMMLLILISGVLGLAYVVIRKVMKGRRITLPEEEIEVVSTRRIGPRHQIVVVRALGENHLLSIHGTQTTRIASSAADLREPVDLPLADAIRHSDAPARDDSRDSGFSAELHRLADRRLGTLKNTPAQDAPMSDAVAGLVRLRASGGR